MNEYLAEVETAIEHYRTGFITAYELMVIIGTASRPSLAELREQHNEQTNEQID